MEGQSELHAAVQAQLQRDDLATFVCPVRRLVSGVGISRTIALVRHVPTDEFAFFIFAKVDSSMLVEMVLPIYEDLRLGYRGDTTIELQYPSRQQSCICDFSIELVPLAEDALNGAIESAKKARLSSSGDSHTWIGTYLGSPHIPQASEKKETEKTEPPKGKGDGNVELFFRSRDPDEVKNPLVSFAQQSNGEYDPSKFMSVKEMWVAGQMREREAEFTTSKTITVFLGTWNVNGKKPEEPLDEWLCSSSTIPDIIAVGFQELDLSAEALFLGDTNRSQAWEEAILRTINKRHNYVMLMSKQLVGMLLVVCVKAELQGEVSEPMNVVAGVGIMGMMGNKGGVAIRFKYCDSTICIVNSHLNAHDNRVERRNQDYQDLCRRLLFNNNELDIFSHEHLLWIGDLNYRLDCDNEEVRRKITEKDWPFLFQFDQLQQQQKKGTAFDCFTEGQIDFAPTYKYDTNSEIYDTSEKARTPSWCDRILWKGKKIKQITYSRHELMSSDHRPVSSLMELQIKSIIQTQRNQVYQDIVKRLDKMENECMPDANISSNNVEFVDVAYFVPCHQYITIENTSKVVVRFRFIPKLDQKNISKPWLDVRPPYGMIMPGEKIDVRLTVFINNAWGPDFNFGRERLEDILILHLEKGKDYFVAVTGNYLKSSFGNSLEHLVCFPGPIRFSSDETAVQNSEKLSVPKELWRIIDYIFKRGLDEPGLFMESGNQHEMDQIRELLDTGGSFELYVGSIHSMAEVLIQFLDSLSEPVIPTSLYRQCLEASSSYSQCKQLLSYLPTVHYNVFYYLMAFLREVVAHSDKNKLRVDQAALLFSSVLIRRGHNTTKKSKLVNEETRTRKAEFVQHFLSSKEKLKVP